ncbi:peptidylprolyl isomerase [Uliginosibacterium gangwonense]|uniref:peptidylprolyl isomerase n=1 Tax=Uliginosibacterium gangwonense TaxID=392736 RepID=UPI000476EDD7|nr:peptidylprolyl isomerase [Uliginosibacterium gangwonense]
MQAFFRIPRLLCAVALMAALSAQAQVLDKVVAVVNKDVVTQSELNTRQQLITSQLKRKGTALPSAAQLRSQVLERLIMERIQLQQAEAVGIRVDESMLDRAVGRIAEDNKMDMAAFRKAVADEGFSWEQFREQIRTEITLAQLREREVDSRIDITNAELEAALNNQDNNAMASSEFQLAHILLRAPEGATPEQWKAVTRRAEDVLALIKQGEDFSKVAATYSNAQDAMQGGMLDWRPFRRLPEIFAERLTGMKKGDVSPILRSPVGLHIFKFVDMREAAQTKTEIEQTHARHILLRASDTMSEAEAVRRLSDLRDRIRNGADFGEIAKANSSDLSAVKGGDLGWISPGDTVPDFERAMNALKPGEVSDVVQSPFGWHLIQVIQRRKMDVTEERRKFEVRKALRDRKSDESYEDWLRQLRDTAYVEIKPEDY